MKLKYVQFGILVFVLSCSSKNNNEEEPHFFQQEKVSVESQVLKKEVMNTERVANGKLSSYMKAELSLKTYGVIKNILRSSGNNFIQKGELIAELEITGAKQELENSKLNLEKAKLDFQDFLLGRDVNIADTATIDKELLKLAKIKSGYELALNSYNKAKFEYDNCCLYAPFSGKVIMKDILPGAYLSNGTPVGTLYDDSKIIVDFEVLESEISHIKLSQSIAIIPFAYSNDTVYGKVTAILPSVDANGLIKVKGEIKNPGYLIDGMNAKVIIKSSTNESLVVPRSAIVLRQGYEVLFRVINGKAYWTYVNIVSENSSSFAVVPNKEKQADLNEGDTIIISNNLNLAHDTEVILVNEL